MATYEDRIAEQIDRKGAQRDRAPCPRLATLNAVKAEMLAEGLSAPLFHWAWSVVNAHWRPEYVARERFAQANAALFGKRGAR